MGFIKRKIVKVGVSVSTDNKIEAVVVDLDSKMVLDYRMAVVDYNFQTKEIANYEAFGAALKTMLIDEMGLNPRNIELSVTIPNILFASMQVPSNVQEGSELETICAYQAQDSYLFKRHEPVTAAQKYPPMPGKEETTAIYSAIQESAAEQIKNAILALNIENFTIYNPYGAIINGLEYLGRIDEQINSNERWNFVQITNNGFTLFSMLGSRIVEINDMPLPLKTFAPEEIYESMALSLQNNLSIYPAPSLFVLSKTDLLSAEVLLQRMDVNVDVSFFENNKYSRDRYIDCSDKVDSDFVNNISIEAVGAAITTKTSPFKLDYLSNKNSADEIYGYIKLFGQDIAVTDSIINIMFIAIAGVIFLIGAVIYFGAGGINGYYERKISEYQKEKADIEQQIAKARGETEGSVENIIADISQFNKNTIQFFDAISKEIPNNMWLTYYYSDSSGALATKGETGDVNALYEFFKGLKASVPKAGILLSKLQYNDIDAVLSSNGHGNTSMNFEITNSSYSRVKNMMSTELEENKDGGAVSEPANNNANKDNGEAKPSRKRANDNNKNADGKDKEEFDESGFPTLPVTGLKPQ